MKASALLTPALLLVSCGSRQAPPLERAAPDPTAESWYAQSVEELQKMTKEAERQLRARKREQAAAILLKARPVVARLLAVPRPTLAATEAASEFDGLYGRMLFDNGHYGWARLQFQKNVARWTHWRPQTEETRRRLEAARRAIAECDRRIAKQSSR